MDEQLDKLAFSFFKLFARYEYFLKENGYFHVTNGGKIIVDWDRFVNEKIGQDYIEKLGERSNSAEYILSEPPKKQIINPDGLIVWGDVSNQERSVQILFGYISRVRNNLYHGAKFNGTWFDPQRSERLLKHGLVVLEHFKYLINVH